MGQVLYRKYRSRNFDEVIGQEHITQTLKRAIATGTVAHAYLFTGPRGVGKTSVARILAHEVNKLDYDSDKSHLDIIEIDAASNRRIDEIRDLREKVHLAPALAEHKVYIIDEVHMLTREAFNALLKTLEEPPSHIIFILATTEAHKVPETIISRTQRFAFRPIEPEAMTKQLADIAKNESIEVDKAALELIAIHAQGSFRDALSILDQVMGQPKPINASAIEELLGLPPSSLLAIVLGSFEAGDLRATFEQLDGLLAQGVTSQSIAKGLSRLARDRLLDNPQSLDLFLPLIERLLEVENSTDPHIALETALAASLPDQGLALEPVAVVEIAPSAEPKTSPDTPTPAEPPETHPPQNKPGGTFEWSKLLESARSTSQPLYALLRMSTAEYSSQEAILKLRCRFSFHAKRLTSNKHQQTLMKLVNDQVGKPITIEVVEDVVVETPTDEKTLESVANLLGGEVVDL